MEVNKAWEQSKDEIDDSSRYGTWKNDYFLSKPDPAGHFCHKDEIRLAVNVDLAHGIMPEVSNLQVQCIVLKSQHTKHDHSRAACTRLPCHK